MKQGMWMMGLVLAAGSVQAVELPRVFADGMVLQRGQPLPVWGHAAPGAKVSVDFAGQHAQASADAEGNWQVQLQAMPAGGPYLMQVDDAAAPRQLQDVYVGEVWLASGQSNMEWPLAQTEAAEAAIAAANDPLIRHYKVPKSWAGDPQWQLAGGSWAKASPQTVADFSAIAYYFARQLRARTGVAVGIIDSTWGGSNIEAWTDAGTQGLDAAAIAAQASALRESDGKALLQTRANLAHWPQLPADAAGWEAADADESNWLDIAVPGLWESQGWNGMDGVAWYRASFTLSAAEASRGVLLGVGRIDDSDVTWVNGQQVGHTELQYDLPRRYEVPAAALHAGLNHVALRVQDFGGGGGIHGQADEVFVQPEGGAARALDGGWKFRVESAQVALVDDKNQYPALLYNAMIHPLRDYPVRGVIWYQGEANAATVEQATAYRRQFPALIEQWRAQWHAPALPFLWVQLAPFSSGADQRDADGGLSVSPWALLRESQSATLAVPATAQVVITDAGDANNIHPRNKRVVGERLALAARQLAYGDKDVVASGPVFERAEADGAALRLHFRHGAAMAARDGQPLRGFEVAAADGRFHPAQARIEGAVVELHSAAVARPVQARYGWNDTPQDANLVGASGLPASPFRTTQEGAQ